MGSDLNHIGELRSLFAGPDPLQAVLAYIKQARCTHSEEAMSYFISMMRRQHQDAFQEICLEILKVLIASEQLRNLNGEVTTHLLASIPGGHSIRKVLQKKKSLSREASDLCSFVVPDYEDAYYDMFITYISSPLPLSILKKDLAADLLKSLEDRRFVGNVKFIKNSAREKSLKLMEAYGY